MSEVTLSVKVQGLEQLRETVALLKELKELGAGNPDILTEVHVDGAVIPKVKLQEEEPWYPDTCGGWIEHNGGFVPEGISEYATLLTKGERRRKQYGDSRCKVSSWTREFRWANSGDDHNDVVAYRSLP